ncbi:putative outer membrane usher protein, partial [Escherichia coli ECC-1470]
MLVKMTRAKVACLTPELVAQFGLKEDVANNLQWSHDAKCLKSGQ